MSESAVELEREKFFGNYEKARAALPLSEWSVGILEMCRVTTRKRPAQNVSFARAAHLRDNGLLDYRAFDKKLGAGGHFITEIGNMALSLHYDR